MKLIALVALGGAIGATGRYLVGLAAARLLGLGFPWGTLAVNVVGSAAMGLLIGYLTSRTTLANEELEAVRIFVATGVLGGFTTFSAFSLDAVNLLQRGETTAAILYVGCSVLFSIGALVAGLALARQMASL
ncbi:MAG: fluoride efflux transporter CrcB [Rhizobiales bacterium]|nr:fluoride efflux transporter CrcB [Hyphomicrobiales bacterium]